MGGERAKIKIIVLTSNDDIVIDMVGTPTAATAGDFDFGTPIAPMPAKVIALWGEEKFFSEDINLANYSETLSVPIGSLTDRDKGGDVSVQVVSSTGEILAEDFFIVPPAPKMITTSGNRSWYWTSLASAYPLGYLPSLSQKCDDIFDTALITFLPSNTRPSLSSHRTL